MDYTKTNILLEFFNLYDTLLMICTIYVLRELACSFFILFAFKWTAQTNDR